MRELPRDAELPMIAKSGNAAREPAHCPEGQAKNALLPTVKLQIFCFIRLPFLVRGCRVLLLATEAGSSVPADPDIRKKRIKVCTVHRTGSAKDKTAGFNCKQSLLSIDLLRVANSRVRAVS